MLHELYQELRQLSEPSPDQEEQTRLHTFERLLQIIQTPPLGNDELFALTKVLGEAHKHSVVPIVPDKWNVPTMSFAVVGQRHRPQQRYPMIILPRNYLQQVRENPLNALAGIVNMASQVRDFLCGLLETQETGTRARAFEAEFVWVIRKLHEQEGLQWNANPYQLSILSEFPGGLASLAPELRYITPKVFVFPGQEKG